MSVLQILMFVFSGIVAVSTALYMIFTRKIVKETQAMRRAQAEPWVVVYVEPSEHWINLLYLVVRNVGNGLARNIKLTADPNFEYIKGEFLNDLGIFKHGIDSLAPGQIYRLFFTSMVEDTERKMQTEICITVEYESAVTAQRHRNSFTIRFKEFQGFTQVGEPPLQQLVKHTRDLVNEVRSVRHMLKSEYIKVAAEPEEHWIRKTDELRKKVEELEKGLSAPQVERKPDRQEGDSLQEE